MADSRPDSSPNDPTPVAADEVITNDRLSTLPEGRTLRQHTARGTIVNASFNIGLAWIGLLRRFFIAAFLTAADYGLWGLILVSLSTLLFLKEVGIGDKYIQQNELDQERAFQKAFTLEAIVSGGFFVLGVVAVPLFSLLYGEPGMIVPGYVLCLAIPLSLLSFPRIIFYRRMQYARQRVLEAIEPLTGLVVTLVLGALGASYWSLVAGVVAGAAAAGITAAVMSPYRLRFAYDRGTLREYTKFSWPLVISQSSSLVTVQAMLLAGKASVGLAGIGVIGLAGQFSTLASNVNGIITRTLYPAVCAVADRIETLHETFVKSNRLGIMWGVPFGLGLALFAGDLVHHVLGDRWEDAIPLMRAFGIAVAIGEVGYGWSAFMRARNDTRGIAVVSVGVLVAALTLTVPTLLLWGLEGLFWGQIAQATVALLLRGHYLRRLFRGFSLLSHTVRAIVPSIPAVAIVLGIRLLESGERTGAMAVFEIVVYVLTTAGLTWLFERDLLRELAGYLRRKTRQPATVG